MVCRQLSQNHFDRFPCRQLRFLTRRRTLDFLFTALRSDKAAVTTLKFAGPGDYRDRAHRDEPSAPSGRHDERETFCCFKVLWKHCGSNPALGICKFRNDGRTNPRPDRSLVDPSRPVIPQIPASKSTFTRQGERLAIILLRTLAKNVHSGN